MNIRVRESHGDERHITRLSVLILGAQLPLPYCERGTKIPHVIGRDISHLVEIKKDSNPKLISSALRLLQFL